MTPPATNGSHAAPIARNLEFKGVFPAPPTPIAKDGSVNEKALRALLDDNIANGVGGFWMAGSTGEGPILTEEQREAVARVSGEVTQGRALAIMHVGAISTASAVKAAKQAKEHGCAAVCCVPPFFFRTSVRSQIDHYKAVADAADGLPFFVYNLPQLTQVETVPALMEKFMAEVPTIIGLKHSAMNFQEIRAFADMGLKCFSGNGALPLPALTMGAVGTVDAPLSIAPWHYSELFAAWERGDMARAQELQDGVGEIVSLVRMFEAPADVCKAILSERLGIDCGRSIPPVNRLTDEQRKEVVRLAKERGFTERHAAVGV
ncbi:MAG: dihydrodipicolinate synthase family protein [Chloroflexi bacterium]|nr:dihydrodipicolinate synthase family protein [Chloroflexota bacterium]